MKSAVFIIPAEHVEAGNALGEAMGWGARCYSVPLSPTGEAPATHYGCRADVGPEFLALLADPPQSAAPVLAVVHMDLSDTLDGIDHWQTVTDAARLRMIRDNDPRIEGYVK